VKSEGVDRRVTLVGGPDPLEATRFVVPTPPRGVVRRPRLEERLDAGIRGPLTLVTAPAGTGKTVLVSSWASRRADRSTLVWLSLDDSTVGTAAFWHLIVTGLARHGVDVSEALSPGPQGANSSFTSTIAGRILAHDHPVILVLDCDGVLPSEVAAPLNSLIRQSGGALRVVLLTREDPLLPLHRYRLDDAMVEVRMADLAFTSDEGRKMLGGMGVRLSSATMDAIIGRTQGWAAGLRMAAMSLAHRHDGEEAAKKLAGDAGTVAEYLLAEVLDTQPKALRQLLLDTSVADVLRPGLGVALAGAHADRALSFLVHGNAFLEELGDVPGGYRYHHLFRELLRAQLAYESPARSMQLHRVAAAWHADNGLVVDAVRHAVITKDWQTAAIYALDDLSIVTLLRARGNEPLSEALARIPKAAKGAPLTIVRTAQAVASGDWKAAASGLRSARRLFATRRDSWPAGALSVAVLDLVCARHAGATDAVHDAAADANALMDLQEPARLAAHPEIRAVIQSSLGAALVIAGRLDAAAEAFDAAAERGKIAGREHALIDALGHAALLAALRGDLTRSADVALRAVRVSSAAGQTPVACPSAAEVALAYVHTERYDLERGHHHAARAAVCEPTPHDPLPDAMLALTKARLCWATGDHVGGRSLLDAAAARGGLPDWLADRLRLDSIAMLVADGRYDEAANQSHQLAHPASRDAALQLAGAEPIESAEAAGTPAVPMSSQRAPLSARVETLVRSAAQYARAGADKQAVRELDRALRLAAPELSRRVFREAPEDIGRLLRQHDDLRARHAWLTDREPRPSAPDLLPHPRDPVHVVGPSDQTRRIYEPLTAKESEVLGHLSELLTTEEIAAVMFISVNTVRTHVRNILRKLAASRRNEAVRRARALRLIPD
jgi:LuxR family transcriptional regulator, maltose regulon positive regulatory protein